MKARTWKLINPDLSCRVKAATIMYQGGWYRVYIFNTWGIKLEEYGMYPTLIGAKRVIGSMQLKPKWEEI